MKITGAICQRRDGEKSRLKSAKEQMGSEEGNIQYLHLLFKGTLL